MFSPSDETLLPSLRGLDDVHIEVVSEDQIDRHTVTGYLVLAKEKFETGGAVGVMVDADGEVPGCLGLSREGLDAAGFEGKVGDTLVIPSEEGLIVAVGIGGETASVHDLRNATAAFVRAVNKTGAATLVIPSDIEINAPEAAAIVEGAILARNRYTMFKSEHSAAEETPLQSLTLALGNHSVTPAKERREQVLRGVTLGLASSRATLVARDLTNAPPAHLTPSRLAEYASSLADSYGFEADVLKRKQLKELGCGGILAVNRGSKRPARLIKLSYTPEGATEDTKRLTLVGKGITFDSGGLSLKPSESMIDMKMDMGGAAAVIGAFTALADLGVSVSVDAYIPTTDNMISGDSYRLGEVLVARDGHTVEVKNTDAEGRLVLMDALALAAESNPNWIVDIATLTGAAIVALGTEVAALFGTDRVLVEAVEKSAEQTGEAVWEMPLRASYNKLLKSSVADLQNVGGRWGGPITAALFLQNFVGDSAWAHLDIAGPMSAEKDDGWVSAGATGYGARLLLTLAYNLGVSEG
mgnify:CR=1 FL=1